MILSCDFQSYITFEFAQRQRGMPLGVVFAAFLDVTGSGSRQEMDRSHLGPDKAFDMSAKMGFPTRTPNDLDAFVPASPLKSATSKISPVVHMDVFGQSSDGPSFLDLALPKPSGLVEYSMSRQRLVDNRDGGSMVKWNPVTMRVKTSSARVSQGRPTGLRVSSSTTKASTFV